MNDAAMAADSPAWLARKAAETYSKEQHPENPALTLERSMNRDHGQGTHSDVVESQTHASVSVRMMPASDGSGATHRLFFGLELRHCLKMHGGVAFGFALFGVAAAIFVLRSSPASSAKELSRFEPAATMMPIRLNPARWTGTGNAGENEATSGQKQPGPKYRVQCGKTNESRLIAVGAAPPSMPVDSGKIRDVLFLVLGFTVLGVAAAVIAHRLDARVYVASDVERVLGFPPTAQLPDFEEVSNDVAEQHILRLASGIDDAIRKRDLKNCVFTAVVPGAGATTVVTRVKEMLEALGNLAVVVDAADARAITRSGHSHKSQDPNEPEGFAAVLLQHAPEAAELRRGQMILADARPLTTSLETEQMLRQADSAIVVIESGVTTREQLRRAAEVLQRVKAPAVGFVLNRVKQAKADAAFHRSVDAVTANALEQSRMEDQHALDTLRFALELGRVSMEPEVVPTEGVAGNLHRENGSSAVLAEHPVDIAAEAKHEGTEPAACSIAVDTAQPLDDLPWWLAEAPPRSDASLTQPRIRRNGSAQTMPNGAQSHNATQDETKRSQEDGGPERLPRLTELRGTLFSSGIKELDHAKHGNGHAAEAKYPTDEGTPLEALLGAREDTAGLDARHGVEAESAREFVRGAERRSERAARNGTEGRNENGRENTAEPQLLLPKPKPMKGSSHQDVRKPIDGVEILPSRRGQYKRKG
jgi:hypothetical protein